MVSAAADSADDNPVVASNVMVLLALSTALGCGTLLLARRPTFQLVSRLLLPVAAALFGIAVGLRATTAESGLPEGLRFAVMASFGSYACYRSWAWIRRVTA